MAMFHALDSEGAIKSTSGFSSQIISSNPSFNGGIRKMPPGLRCSFQLEDTILSKRMRRKRKVVGRLPLAAFT
ncbi:MAG TPA: hypothetical protein VHM90_04235 [Phycisphaerae bacterium]|nr:hypothetical protein [Phycisphaerae bacterium]